MQSTLDGLLHAHAPGQSTIAPATVPIRMPKHAAPERVVALVPAHNEAATIAASVAGLRPQVNRVIVVADNCTDDTAARAFAAGAEVFGTVHNVHKKAGALNQAIARLGGDFDYLMVVDADSVVATDFVAHALTALADPTVGAVGGVFYGEDGFGLVGQLQRNEYHRYARDIARRGAKAAVLTGTATIFPAEVVAEVIATRPTGGLYDLGALTEDMEITLAVKTLGYRCLSPKECTVATEVMPTWGDLWRQRIRWSRGAFENLRAYGLTRVTLPYFGVQLAQLGVVFASAVYWTLLFLLLYLHRLGFSPFWSGIGLLLVAERMLTVWRAGVRGRWVALAMVPEIIYGSLQQLIFLRCLFDTVFGRAQRWHHVEQRKEV